MGSEPTSPLFVRLPTASAEKLSRAAFELKTPKRELVADLVDRYLGAEEVPLGRAASEQREVYEVVRVANETAAQRVRAGMSGRDADAIARDYIQQRGYGELFGHSLGHGLGLEVHEAPRLSKTAEGVLAEGAVVTIEPGIYRPGWGGVRIEDDVFLGAGGTKILTRFTRELIELG